MFWFLSQSMPGAKNIDVSTFWIEEEVSCKSDYEAVGENCGKLRLGVYSLW